MPNRILKETICTSDTLAELTEAEENFFYRLMVQCDDYGRMDARPAILRARCYPLHLDRINEAEISRRLQALARVGLLWIYEVDGRSYLQVTTWEKHQQRRAQYSKYPQPPEGSGPCKQLPADDSNREQPHADVSETRGVEESGSEESRNETLGADAAPAGPEPPAEPEPPKQRARSQHDDVRLALEIHFSEQTDLPRPETATDAQKRSASILWWQPLKSIAELCAWDVGEATRLIDAAITQLKGRCTIASPKSIAATALAIKTGNAGGNGQARAAPGQPAEPKGWAARRAYAERLQKEQSNGNTS